MSGNRKEVDVTALVGSKSTATSSGPAFVAKMHLVAGNPDNPRAAEDYTDADQDLMEMVNSMSEVGQLQPIGVVTRDVWLRHRPHHTDAIGNAQYVVFGGNRRLAAAKMLRWTQIDIRVQDHLGDGDDDKFDEAVLVENIQRKRLDPVREAEYLQRMVTRHGSQDVVAERIGKSQMYVSQRLALLNLVPELKEAVASKELKVAAARQIARKDPEEQRTEWSRIQEEAVQPKPKRAAPPARVQNPVLKPAPDQASPAPQSAVQNPVLNRPDPQVSEDSEVPKPREESQEPTAALSAAPPRRLPERWEDGVDLIVAEYGELERHLLTNALRRLMDTELGSPVES